MPLSTSVLKQELVKIMDKNSGSFQGFPYNNFDCAQRWSEAVAQYAQSIIPPSTTVNQAKQAFATSFSSINPNANNGNQVFQTSFAQFAVVLGSGMVGWVATPPPFPLNISPVSIIGLSGGSGTDCAEALAQLIDAWFRTGIAVNSNGTINWS